MRGIVGCRETETADMAGDGSDRCETGVVCSIAVLLLGDCRVITGCPCCCCNKIAAIESSVASILSSREAVSPLSLRARSFLLGP